MHNYTVWVTCGVAVAGRTGVCNFVYGSESDSLSSWSKLLNSPCCVRKVNMDCTHTLLNPFLLCLLRSASSGSSCSSSFAITARVGEGGVSREYRAYFGLTFGVQCARTLYCEQHYASIGVRNATLGRHAGSSFVL